MATIRRKLNFASILAYIVKLVITGSFDHVSDREKKRCIFTCRKCEVNVWQMPQLPVFAPKAKVANTALCLKFSIIRAKISITWYFEAVVNGI